MSDKTTRRAARSLGGFVLAPAISREEATKYLNAEISAEAWSKIVMAFYRFGDTVDDLNASRMSKSKDPSKNSWHERQRSTVTALEAALGRIQSAQKQGNFLREASENYSLAVLGYSAACKTNADGLLRDAWRNIFDALVIIERAEPRELEIPTEASARAVLIRAIRDALVEIGIEAKASTGRYISDSDRAITLKDLTPFEQFLDALGIGENLEITSFTTAVRAALKG